jgi:hypothetical protein
MLLSKVKSFRPFLLWKTYSTWLVFCICILILTNGFASLTLIREYRFSVTDILVTYGFIIFWGILESGILAGFMVLAEVLLEGIFKKRLDIVFRLILFTCLMITWIILLSAAIRFVRG